MMDLKQTAEDFVLTYAKQEGVLAIMALEKVLKNIQLRERLRCHKMIEAQSRHYKPINPAMETEFLVLADSLWDEDHVTN